MKQRGFTLLEVMVGLALLGLALTVLIKSAAGSIFNAEEARMMGVATDLARGKMYDIEEKLLKDGFTDTDQSECDRDFTEEGWPAIKYCAKVDQVEFPNFDELQKMMLGQGSGAGSGAKLGSGAGLGSGSGGGGFGDSMLGGMLGMFGGSAKDVTGMQGASLIQSQYQMFQQILKVSIRKVTLTVSWKVLGDDQEMKVVEFLTDPAAMDQVLNGMGSQDLDDVPQANGGTGANPTGTSTTGKPPITTGGGAGR